ncbi:hypothetical protein, partial [Conchiformibius steedae]
MKTIKLLYIVTFSMFLFSCTEKQENKAQHPAPVVYDYRDEKNQDAYSRYRRANKVDWVTFNSDEIRKTLGKPTIPDGIHGKIYIHKIEARHQRTLDTFTSKEEMINYYGSKFSKKTCKENNVQGLVCLESKTVYNYFYLPNINTNLSKRTNFPSFLFACDRGGDFNCSTTKIASPLPYNISVRIHFNHPSYIFPILDYI